jgi:hypothetical protein
MPKGGVGEPVARQLLQMRDFHHRRVLLGE